MLTKETINYLLTELQSRLEVLDDLMAYELDDELLEGWCEEVKQTNKAIEELHAC